MENSLKLTEELSKLGLKSRRRLELQLVEPFKTFFDSSGQLKHSQLDELHGNLTRREILARYLLLNAVLDQGPDMEGVAIMLRRATSTLYAKGIPFFHQPELFFKNLATVIQAVKTGHDEAKKARSDEWASTNDSSATKYNLFFAQSTRGQVSIKQVMDYTIHRWGVPVSLFLLLEQTSQSKSKEPLVDYLESHDSAELMSNVLKDDEDFGLGSAIGDKAAHLYAKNYVSIYKLKRRSDKGWSGLSYELPFDSNAGRVLFRTGFFFDWTTLDDLENVDAIQKGQGKQGANYIRVTNIRGMKTDKISSSSELFQAYVEVVREHLRTEKKPRLIQIQRLPNFLVYQLDKSGRNYDVADFDDGLMEVGTNYCLNTSSPLCQKCPISKLCLAYNGEKRLIDDYKT